MNLVVQNTIHVIQGGFAVSDDPTTAIVTLLGSCVSTCLFDPIARIGGLNHFLLTGEDNPRSRRLSYGSHAMELLINTMLSKGARRKDLQAKIFGGASITAGFSDIGQSNSDFALRYLEKAGIICLGADIGGSHARKIRQVPTSGRVQVMLVDKHMFLAPMPLNAASSDDGDLF